MLAFLNNLWGGDSIVILIVALLIFGKRLPEVMRSLGASVNEFKRGLNDPPIVQAPVAAPAAVPVVASEPVQKQMP
jgi:TatA/E family protein of Tat protein translocase